MAANPGGYYYWRQQQAVQKQAAQKHAAAQAWAQSQATVPQQRALRRAQQKNDVAVLRFILQNMIIAAVYALPAFILGAQYSLPAAFLYAFGIGGTVLLVASPTRTGLRFLFRHNLLRVLFGSSVLICPLFAPPLFLLGVLLRWTGCSMDFMR
jgi:hypothetical protein